MPRYEYHKIAELSNNLQKAGISRGLIAQIMEGGEAIRKGATPQDKADWMKKAMIRMDKLLDKDTRQEVREACACCLGGKRLETSKAIAKRNGTLRDRIKATNKANYIGSVMMQKDGRIKVAFAPEGLPEYGCACFGRKVKGPLPITYCYCCGGHVKHHLQIALGQKLECQVRSSALSSVGKKPCTFLFSLEK